MECSFCFQSPYTFCCLSIIFVYIHISYSTVPCIEICFSFNTVWPCPVRCWWSFGFVPVIRDWLYFINANEPAARDSLLMVIFTIFNLKYHLSKTYGQKNEMHRFVLNTVIEVPSVFSWSFIPVCICKWNSRWRKCCITRFSAWIKANCNLYCISLCKAEKVCRFFYIKQHSESKCEK